MIFRGREDSNTSMTLLSLPLPFHLPSSRPNLPLFIAFTGVLGKDRWCDSVSMAVKLLSHEAINTVWKLQIEIDSLHSSSLTILHADPSGVAQRLVYNGNGGVSLASLKGRCLAWVEGNEV